LKATSATACGYAAATLHNQHTCNITICDIHPAAALPGILYPAHTCPTQTAQNQTFELYAQQATRLVDRQQALSAECLFMDAPTSLFRQPFYKAAASTKPLVNNRTTNLRHTVSAHEPPPTTTLQGCISAFVVLCSLLQKQNNRCHSCCHKATSQSLAVQ
jgi:hypothetical protein